ncbi:hypothetical protein HZB05_02905 [Candidatus Wolfebacteria bacterium]|nr:hypothetical protein [Candidatus Wolfebacteria bacterium]
MLQISKEQLYSRYDSSPQVLKEALFSEETDNLLWKIGEAHHLSDDKKSILATLVGDVILGFIHLDDFEKQISMDLGIDTRIAQSLIVEINKKILASIKSEIEQNYQAPMAVIDIKRAETPPALPVIEGEIKPVPIAVEPLVIPPAEIKIEKPGEATKPEALFEEAPAIIHKEEKAQAVAPAKVSLGGLMGIFKRTAEKTAEAPQVAAEVVGIPTAQPETGQPATVQTEKPKLRVVHYGDLRTPITPVEIFGKEGFIAPVVAEPQEPKIEILKPATPPIEAVIPKEPKFKRVDFKESEISPAVAPAAETMASRPAEMKPPAEQAVKIQPDLSAKASAEPIKMPKPEPMKPIMEKREIGLKEIPVSEEVLDLRTLEKSKNE